MQTELIRSSHTTGECCLHLQFTIAYRSNVFEVEKILPLVKLFLKTAADRLKVEIAPVEAGPDHIHLFLLNWKNYSIPELVKRLKGFSSRMLRKRYSELIRNYLWGNKFWSAGYFYRTVGSVTADNVKRYIEMDQEKHWD